MKWVVPKDTGLGRAQVEFTTKIKKVMVSVSKLRVLRQILRGQL